VCKYNTARVVLDLFGVYISDSRNYRGGPISIDLSESLLSVFYYVS
jgi:hypothetical protein